MKLTKRFKIIKEKIDRTKTYMVTDALELLKSLSKVKFDETVEACINLGIDPKKSDQNVRGSVVLPNGIGKTVRVAVFAQGDKADEAKAAGADIIGFEDLADSIKSGSMDFDILIATPDAMRIVGTLGQILGPRGLMPNPKVGTVSADVTAAVKNAKAGQVQFRSEKGGIIHCTIGKVNFGVDKLQENLISLMAALLKAKPSSAKGAYTKKITLTTTMGPGLVVDISSIDK